MAFCIEASKTFTVHYDSTCINRGCPRRGQDVVKTITQNVCVASNDRELLELAVAEWQKIRQHLQFFPRFNTYTYPVNRDGSIGTPDITFSLF